MLSHIFGGIIFLGFYMEFLLIIEKNQILALSTIECFSNTAT